MTTLAEAFAMQAAACRALGSELTARVCDSLERVVAQDEGAIGQHLRDWPGDPSYRGDSVPLRLCGALHGLVLAGHAPVLAQAYAAGGVDLDFIISDIFQLNEAWILEWLKHAPQTNEVARSAVLIAAAGYLAQLMPDTAFDMLELGASAGLNLNFQHYCIVSEENPQPTSENVSLSPQWRQDPPPTTRPRIGVTRGVDLNPLDPQRDGLRLLAYIWADQAPRLARMRAALAIAHTHKPIVDKGDAGPWLTAQLTGPPAPRLVYHTITAQYFPAQTRAQVEVALQAAGQRATAAAPLAHFSMELEAADAALRLRLWAGGAMREWDLGRTDPHARWIDWHPKEVT